MIHLVCVRSGAPEEEAPLKQLLLESYSKITSLVSVVLYHGRTALYFKPNDLVFGHKRNFKLVVEHLSCKEDSLFVHRVGLITFHMYYITHL